MSTPLRLLIVEDSESDAVLLLRELRSADFQVTHQRVETAAEMGEALNTGAWDLIIADYSMPRFDGVAALRMVRERGLEIPFIFLSGTIGEETAVAAMRLGAQDYIMKGDQARLLPAIRRELAEAKVRTERRRLERQLRQAQRGEAIGRLASGIAHDFNNVIGAILGWAELGQELPPESPRVAEMLGKIRDQAHHAAGLTRQILAFARRQILEPRDLSLNQTVQETVALLHNLIGENIAVETVLAEDLAIIRADPTQMEQVLMNLCLNARDAMPRGGRLRLETSNVTLEEGRTRALLHAAPGPYVLLAVSDTGAGMDEAVMEQIFEPFFTTKEQGRGTGLGLATCQGIVQQHGGFIDVDSALGRGSMFRVYLPAVAGQVKFRRPPREEPVRGGTETLLLAEDHEGLREVARERLEALGYHVLVAADGEEALALFRAQRAQIDLVILDMVMPRMGGVDAYLEMSSGERPVRALFTTGYAQEAGRHEAVAGKDVVFLQKPYSGAALGQKVREMLDAS
jgi:signal transduction histidine kinase